MPKMKIALTNEGHALMALHGLPLLRTEAEYRAKKLEAEAAPEVASAPPLLVMGFKKAPSIPSKKKDPEGHKKAKREDAPAIETATIKLQGGDCMHFSAPLGTLLNAALSLFEQKAQEAELPPFEAGSASDLLLYSENSERLHGAKRVKEWIDVLLKEGVLRGSDKITANRVMMFFLASSVLPDSFPEAGFDSCRALCLMDVIFYSLYYAAEASRTPPVLKRCETCGRLFFASPSHRKRCYVEVKDAELRGMSCFVANETRRTRESTSQKEIEKVLARIRKRYVDDLGRATQERLDFMDAYEEKKASLENGLWPKRELLKWLRAEERAMRERDEEVVKDA